MSNITVFYSNLWACYFWFMLITLTQTTLKGRRSEYLTQYTQDPPATPLLTMGDREGSCGTYQGTEPDL